MPHPIPPTGWPALWARLAARFRRHAAPDIGARAEQPAPHSPRSEAPFDFDAALLEAAWGASVSPGLIRHGFNLRRADLIQTRAEYAALRGNVADRMATIEEQLEALVAVRPPVPPAPKVLRPVAAIFPFSKGAA